MPMTTTDNGQILIRKSSLEPSAQIIKLSLEKKNFGKNMEYKPCL